MLRAYYKGVSSCSNKLSLLNGSRGFLNSFECCFKTLEVSSHTLLYLFVELYINGTFQWEHISHTCRQLSSWNWLPWFVRRDHLGRTWKKWCVFTVDRTLVSTFVHLLATRDLEEISQNCMWTCSTAPAFTLKATPTEAWIIKGQSLKKKKKKKKLKGNISIFNTSWLTKVWNLSGYKNHKDKNKYLRQQMIHISGRRPYANGGCRTCWLGAP